MDGCGWIELNEPHKLGGMMADGPLATKPSNALIVPGSQGLTPGCCGPVAGHLGQASKGDIGSDRQ